MDFYKLAKVLFEYKEVKSFQVSDGGNSIFVKIRAKIELYDHEALSALTKSGRLPANDVQILNHLSDYEQEHCFKITKNDGYEDFFSHSVELLRHDPEDAFGSPFCDLGSFNAVIRGLICRNDYNALASALVNEVRNINVTDVAIMRRFLHYAHDYNHQT